MLRQLCLLVITALLAGLAAESMSAGSASRQRESMAEGKVVVRKIKRYERATWHWQRLMGVRRTPSLRRYLRTRDLRYRRHVLKQWRGRAIGARRQAHNPPHERQWRCLQQHEGPWRDAHDPYWGGLQMDRSFMQAYAPRYLLRRGWANRWTPVEQMWVAERALRAGRGFYPWPNTARRCGLI